MQDPLQYGRIPLDHGTELNRDEETVLESGRTRHSP
jgi:hypothetical protein